MARAESKIIMGYLPLEERHCPEFLSLVAPPTPAVRMLDPFACTVFDAWTSFLWWAGHAALLVRPSRSAGGIDLLIRK